MILKEKKNLRFTKQIQIFKIAHNGTKNAGIVWFHAHVWCADIQCDEPQRSLPLTTVY